MIIGNEFGFTLLEIPPYSAQVAVFDSHARLNQTCLEMFGETIVDKGGFGAVYEIVAEEGVFVAVVINEPSINTVCHEASHICDKVLDRAGVPLTVENTEVKAHLVGYFAEHLWHVVQSWDEDKLPMESPVTLQ